MVVSKVGLSLSSPNEMPVEMADLGAPDNIFETALQQAAQRLADAKPPSELAKQRLEAVRTIAQMQIMSLNETLIGALGGQGSSGSGLGESRGTSSTMAILMQVLSLLPQQPAAEQPRQSSDAPKAEASKEPLDPADHNQIIEWAAEATGLDPNLVRAVVKTESNFDAQAVSKSGAMGLMQLMPETASDLGVGDPFDPVENVFGGTRYLADMLSRYSGNLDKALAAYNWGPGNLDRNLSSASGFMPDETRNYIRIVNHYYDQYGRKA